VTTPSMVQWIPGPVTFTTPGSSRFYYEPGRVLINGTIYLVEAYSDPYQGGNTAQADTYIAYGVNFFGSLVSVNQNIIAPFNTSPPVTIPTYDLNYSTVGFFGSTSQNVFAEYYSSENNDGTVTFHTFTVDETNPALPAVATGPTITVTPVGKTLTDNITAEFATIGNGNAHNNIMFEVAGQPSVGSSTIFGTFDIITPAGGTSLVGGTGFSFSDNKPHDFVIGRWNDNFYAQLVEVWNVGTGFADLQLSTINAGTGAVAVGWTAAMEMGSITRIGYSFLSNLPGPIPGGMLMVVDGTDQTGHRGFVEAIVDDQTSSGGTGGTIYTSVQVNYVGTVRQDAIIQSTGLGNNQYFIWWVDGNGLTINLVQAASNNSQPSASLTVLETYNIAEANGTAHVQTLSDGRLFVNYRVQTPSSNPTSSVQKYTILDTRLTGQIFNESAGTNSVAGTPQDDTFNITGGTNTINGGAGWDKATFNITSAQATITQNGDGSWNIVTPGGTDTLSNIEVASFTDKSVALRQVTANDFVDSNTSDLLWRNVSGEVDTWLMTGGAVTGATVIGALSSAWQFSGSGDLNGDATTDVLWRNTSTGEVDTWLVSNGVLSGGAGIGSVSTAWQALGTADLNGDGTSDALWRNTATGEVDDWLINNGHVTGGAALGTVSSAWQFSGTGDLNGDGTADLLWHNTSTGACEDWLINNGVVVGGNGVGFASSAWQSLGMGDFNNDGVSDVLWRNLNTGEIDDWLIGNGGHVVGGSALGSISSAWQFGGIGDVNNDGTSDVLWRNNNTGEVDTWLVTNGHLTGGTAIGTISTAWQNQVVATG
jgi:hypothetical protein